MPDFPSRADDAVPPAGDSALDELLTAGQPPQEAAAGWQPVAAVLAALRAGPTNGELAGQARALAEFRSTVRVSHRSGRSRARRPAPFRERLSSKLAVITAATAVAVGGTVAAAYVGALPGPLQRVAHDVIAAAPAAHGRPAPAAVRAHPFRTPSAIRAPSPATSRPGWWRGQAGSARKHHKHKPRGHRQDHQGRRTDRHQRAQGNQQGDGPAARPGNNPMALHKGSRLQSPLPRAAAFPIPSAGPRRAGAGGR